MVTKSLIAKLGFAALVLIAGMVTFMPMAVAQEHPAEDGAAAPAGGDNGLRGIGLGIGAGLAVGLAGIGTGLAQSGVGAGGTGAIAEKPELLPQVLILFAIPETIVVFGFVISFLLLNNL